MNRVVFSVCLRLVFLKISIGDLLFSFIEYFLILVVFMICCLVVVLLVKDIVCMLWW